MFDGEYLLFCSGKSSDINGNVTLSGIFDSIVAESFPTSRPDLLITAQLRAKRAVVNKELVVKMTVNVDDEVVVNAELKQPITVEKGNGCTFDFNLQGMPFPSAGTYAFKLYIDEKLYLTRYMRVQLLSDFVEE
jgi:hypothetical protein